MGLEALDAQYEKEAVKDKPAFTLLPDGQYQTKLFALDVVMTKAPPARPMLKLEFEILAGKFAKRRVWKNVMLTGDNIQYLKADLHALGWKHKLSDIEDIQKRATLLDRIVNIGLKTKVGKVDSRGQPQQNCFLNSSQDRVGTPSPSADAVKRASSVSADADDDSSPPF